ncbi:MAG: glycosyl transferase family 4 [Desulfurococcaceae archaeon]
MYFQELIYLLISILFTLFVTDHYVKWWITRAHYIGLVGRDMNKKDNVLVAEAGGVWVIFGTALGLLVLTALYTYLSKTDKFLKDYLALTLLLFMTSFLGFLDDILGWKKGVRILYRVILMIPLSIPLVVIKAGVSKIAVPFIGTLDLGLIYPLLLVPIGIMGASNAFNMIAGYNGLETVQGLILLGYTALFSLIRNIPIVFNASLIMISALIVFLKYNWYPAKIFPGNSLTYGVGAYYASLVIIGNFEKFGLLLFTLYFLEFILFIRGLKNRVYKENFGKIREDGYLDLPYDKIYSLTHFAIKLQLIIKGRASEKGVVYTIALLQLIIGLIALILIKYI